MNGDPPGNSRAKKKDRGNVRLFANAMKDVRREKQRLPEPNYGNLETNLPKTDAFRNEKNYSPFRSDSSRGAKHPGNTVERTHEAYRKREVHPGKSYQRSNSYATAGRRSDISENIHRHIVSDYHSLENSATQNAHSARNVLDNHSSENSATKNVLSARDVCSSSCSNFSMSTDKHSYNISNDLLSDNLASQNAETVSPVDSSYFSDSLESNDKMIPSELHCGNEQAAVFIIPSDPSNFSHHQPNDSHGTFMPCFGSNVSDDTLFMDGFIPPPTPPSKPGYESLPDGTVSFNNNCPSQQQNENITVSLPISDAGGDLCGKRQVTLNCCTTNSSSCNCPTQQQNENITVFLPISAAGDDLCGERQVTLNCYTTTLTSSCNLRQQTIPSVEDQNCRNESGSKSPRVCVTDTLRVEDSSCDECEESSSIRDSPSTVDVKPEQIEAIRKLLIEIEKDRISAEFDRVTDVVETLIRIVKKRIRGCWLKPYGSYISGFAVGTSDINIALIPDKHIVSSHKILQDMIKPILQDIPDCEPVYDGDQDYRNASVSFFEPASNICCKVKILGNDSLYRTAKLLRNFAKLDSRVKTLVIAVRHWAEVCEIHEADNGRLHPLNYVLMMIHFLQQHHPPILPVANLKFPEKMNSLQEKTQSVGDLWLAFFQYYAETFNWKDNVVSIVSKDPVLKSSKSWGKCWIAVEEPYDKLVNVAKSLVSQDVSNFIRMCFLNTYKYFLHPTSPEVIDTFSDEGQDSINDEVSAESNGDSLSGFDYDFFHGNFLNGLCVPIICSACERLGHLCDACLYDENSMLQSLPKMTSEFLRVIDGALERTYECYSISETHLKSREGLIEKLKTYLKKQLKCARIELIGSSVNGFGLKNSDVDICFTLEGQSVENVDAKIMVKKIKNVLLKNREFSDVMYISTSKIPIVKFIDRRTNLRCDISIYNELAVYNTRLLQAYSMIDPRVRVLGCAMKVLARNACLDDTVQRTLSSYSYILMVLYFLQQIEPPVIPVLQELYDKNEPMPEHIVEDENVWFFDDIENLNNVWDGRGKNHQSVGELWVQLLEFYTTKFDFHHFICISQKSPLVELKNVSSAMLFNILDPFIKSLNLGTKMSGNMSRKTLKALQRARVLFGTPGPTNKPPSGYQSFEEYFFSPVNLTDGRVMGKTGCSHCGKLGHREATCKRYKLNTRFWSKVPHKTK